MACIIHERFVGFGSVSFLQSVHRNVSVRITVSGLQDDTLPLSMGKVVLWVVFF